MSLIASLVLFTLAVLPLPALAWNIPGHMLSGIIAYQVLQQENPQSIEKVRVVLEKLPWYANRWQARLQDVPVVDRNLVLFIQTARWPDDIRLGTSNLEGHCHTHGNRAAAAKLLGLGAKYFLRLMKSLRIE